MAAESSCPSCGAPCSGYVCPFCGMAVAATTDVDSQLQAVEELHDLISGAAHKKKVGLLKNGFLPDHARALIEAGLKCIPHINPNDIDQSVTGAAVYRIKAISAKLKLLPADEETGKAIAEFESIVRDYRFRSKWDGFIGAIAVLGVAALVVAYFVFFR